MTRRDAVAQIYGRLRADNADEQGCTQTEAAALLYALGLTLQEIEAAMRAHGDAVPPRR